MALAQLAAAYGAASAAAMACRIMQRISVSGENHHHAGMASWHHHHISSMAAAQRRTHHNGAEGSGESMARSGIIMAEKAGRKAKSAMAA